MSSVSLRFSARDTFRSAGRGGVVTFGDEGDVRYTTIKDLRGTLAKAPELAGLIEVADNAVMSYKPEREAVVLESRYEAVSVYLVRDAEVVTLGTLAFVTLT